MGLLSAISTSFAWDRRLGSGNRKATREFSAQEIHASAGISKKE